ncbi:serine protease, heat shock protein [Corynebacterium renale]|uniref:S1C family serine protease n=1 Tax=Corynebacterium renale TaxID=1724 RepID=UPI000DA3D804|nr:trypsin-like peptidase domain-containing protein [Corynebacterium renale]SQG64287.1 serine protease, heat shock protein [Corynebacterium renale]STC94814.1 serine protease, heat shock protein [Corynebacterium renale]
MTFNEPRGEQNNGWGHVHSPYSGTETFTQPPQPEPEPKKESKKVGLGTAITLAVVSAVAAGGITGVYAVNQGQDSSISSLQNPSVEGAASQEAPDGSVEKVAAAVLPSVVSIQVATNNGVASGSGSIISSDGYVLTNHHVVGSAASDNAQMQVTLNNGQSFPATYVASDPATDIGVIKIEGVTDLPVMQFGDSDQLNVGQSVVAIGSPLGLSSTVTTGIVSALNRPVRASDRGGESSLIDAIQTDAAINPGNSGGPLVDMQGNLIGMNSVIASLSGGDTGGSIGLGFAIPANFAKRVATQLIENGEATQPMLGVQVMAGGAVASLADGAVVARVEPGSPAAEAGLQRGDTIVRMNDRIIDSADALIAATRSHDFGETVTLQVKVPESEEIREVEVTLSTE